MKLLIVDDSKTMRLIVKRAVMQSGIDDIDISEAVDGEDALIKIEQLNPHVILCDWNMPGISGMDVLKKLRDAGNKVLFGFVTSECTKDMVDSGKKAGAQFYITKPFTPEVFGEQLQRVIR